MKKIFIGGVALAVCIGGYLIYQASSTPVVLPVAEEPQVEAGAPQVVQPTTGKSSFRALLAMTNDLECAITATGGTAETLTGSYFASNGIARVDVGLESVTPTTSFSNVTSMIVTNSTIYIWTFIDGEGYGAKTALVNETLSTVKPEPGKQTPIDFDGEVAYDCKTWEVVDKSVFEPPSTIIFKDYTTALQAGMEDGTIYPEAPAGSTLTPEDMQSGNPCALCDKVAPGEGQDQCRANFKCGN